MQFYPLLGTFVSVRPGESWGLVELGTGGFTEEYTESNRAINE